MEKLICDKIVRIVKNRKKLEEALKVKLTNDKSEVSIEGEAQNEYEAVKVIDALNMGFSFSDAISIKKNELEFGKINVKEYSRSSLERIKGRLIGKDGKVLKTLSTLTNCSLEVKGNEIGIIGNPDDMKTAIDSIIQIIQGSKHANVYKGLEKRKEEPIVDWGLKEKEK